MEDQLAAELSTPGTSFTKELGYTWIEPSPPVPFRTRPFWMQPAAPTRDLALAEDIAQREWRVVDLRELIESFGGTPTGRSRADLVEQLVKTYADPTRLRQQEETLSSEERSFLAYLLLYAHLEALRVYPTPMAEVYPFTVPTHQLTQRLIEARLVLGLPHLGYLVTHTHYSSLAATVPFIDEPAPERFTEAQNPMLAVLLMQQFLVLVRSQEYRLRPQLSWSPPHWDSATACWPVTREAALAVRSRPYEQVPLEMLAKAPSLEDRLIEEATTQLGIPADMVEMLYHSAVSLQLIQAGSPLVIDDQAVEAWLGCSPLVQIVSLFQAYGRLAMWAEWFPAWCRRELRLTMPYRGPLYAPVSKQDIAFFTPEVRRVLLGMLAMLPSETWLSVEKITAWIGRILPSQTTLPMSRVVQVLGEPDAWRAFLGLVLDGMLTGALRFLGLADVTVDAGGRPVLCRLHHLRKLKWEPEPDLALPEITSLDSDALTFNVTKEELSVRLPAPAPFLSTIQRWARLAGFSQNVLIYHLEPRILYDAFRDGETPESLALKWRAASDAEVLPQINAWWDHWWGRFGHVRIYPRQVLLTTRDETTLREIQVALPSLRASVLGMLTPKAALLQPEQADQVRDDLQRQGYMPKEIA